MKKLNLLNGPLSNSKMYISEIVLENFCDYIDYTECIKEDICSKGSRFKEFRLYINALESLNNLPDYLYIDSLKNLDDYNFKEQKEFRNKMLREEQIFAKVANIVNRYKHSVLSEKTPKNLSRTAKEFFKYDLQVDIKITKKCKIESNFNFKEMLDIDDDLIEQSYKYLINLLRELESN